MVHAEFLKFVSSVKTKLGSFPNEQAVSLQVVLPVLRFLGWDTLNSDYVYPEYPLEKLKVDYGLKISEGEQDGLRCIIEVKAEGNLDADHQLFQYAFLAGAPLAVLTDGRHWRFYLPMLPGKFEERLVRTLDFGKHSKEDVVSGLIRYISFENTCSGMARKNAESDHDQRVKTLKTKNNISLAWKKLLDGSSDRLVTLLIEETSQISSGYAPARSDVEEFLKNLEIKNVENTKNILRRVKPKPDPPPKPTSRRASFILFGEKFQDQRNVASAFAAIMEILARRDKNFLVRLAPEISGKKTERLSLNRLDLGIDNYVQAGARQLSGGWWLKTHSSTDEKKRILKKACRIAGIPFGKPSGLKVEF